MLIESLFSIIDIFSRKITEERIEIKIFTKLHNRNQ